MGSVGRPLQRAARVILIGAPGVGKGTQSERLVKRFTEISTVSSGDLLRANLRAKSKLGLEAEKAMKKGMLVSDDVVIRLILQELKARTWIPPATSLSDAIPSVPSEDPQASFILDGFPRTDVQAEKLDAIIPVNFVVNLLTPPEIILERIASRWVHEPSGRVYNDGFNKPKVPGKDDITGEALTKRADDGEDIWKERLKKFEETSTPLLEYYDKRGLLWTVKGNSSDEISPKLFDEFERRFT